jgi:hypothetical protein
VFRKFHTHSPFESAVHSLLSGAVQTASEWLIEGIKGLCGRDA